MTSIYPLSSWLNTKIKNPYSTNEQWRLYVKDNRDNIIAKSNYVLINPDTANFYRYRLIEFLESYGVSNENAWIVIWLNKLYSGINFDNIFELIIPDDSVISELLEEFRAYESLRNS